MSLLLAGLTFLVIGDSHLAYGEHREYLITTLHDELMQHGAQVYSYGVCGAKAGDLMRGMKIPHCGFAFRLNDGKIRWRPKDMGPTASLPELVKQFHPDVVVVVNNDALAGYKDAALNKTWVWDEVRSLTMGIKASGTRCVWVGPAWGSEGGKYGKTFARARELSDYLADIVAPCTYINSLAMSTPGEWKTLDGVHLLAEGYRMWGSAITSQIISSDVLQQTVRQK